MAIDKRLQIYDEQGNLVDYDILASDVKFLSDGKDLPTKLAEMQDEIEDAGSVTGVKIGSTTYDPTDGVVDLSSPMSNKVDKNGTDSLMTAAEHTKLGNLPTATELASQMNAKANDNAVVKTISVNGGTPATPVNGNVDISVSGGGETIAFDAGGTAIIDNFDDNSTNANTVLGAASARSVFELYKNIRKLRTELANMAFTDGKPSWIDVGKRSFNLTMTSLTNCTGSIQSGDAGSGKVYEGLVVIRLTLSTGYAFTAISVTKTSGGSAVTFEQSAGTGYVDISFVCTDAVTVSATASAGKNIDFSGSTGCTIDDLSVPNNTNLSTTIRANEHYTLPQSITVKIGTTNVTHTYTRAQDGKTATLAISATNITGDLAIDCDAVEDDHAVLDITNVGSNVTIKRSGSTLADGAHVYQGETINIVPGSGFAVSSASATSGGNTVTLSGDAYSGYSYTLGSGDVSSGGVTIAITASATAVVPKSVSWSGTGFKVYDAASGGNELSSPQSVNEGDDFEAWLVADSFYSIDSVSGATYDSSTGKITVSNVTSDVAITVSTTNTNTAYQGVAIDLYISGNANLVYGPEVAQVLSPLIPVEQGDVVKYNCADSTSSNLGMVKYSSSFSCIGRDSFNSLNKTETMPANAAYVQISCPTDKLVNANIYVNDVLKWSGSTISDYTQLPDYVDFEHNSPILKPDTSGGYVGMAYGYAVTHDLGIGFEAKKAGKNKGYMLRGSGITYNMSKRVAIPTGGATMQFGSTGGAQSAQSYLALMTTAGDLKSTQYDLESANPRTQDIAETYIECQLVIPTSEYQNAFIKISGESETLWSSQDNA